MNTATGIRIFNISGVWTDGTEAETDYVSRATGGYHKFGGDPTGYIHEQLSDGWSRTQWNLTIPHETFRPVASGLEYDFDSNTQTLISGELANNLDDFRYLGSGWYDTPIINASGLQYYQDEFHTVSTYAIPSGHWGEANIPLGTQTVILSGII